MDVGDLVINVINDCGDAIVPWLTAHVRGVQLTVQDWSSELSVATQTTVGVMFFNSKRTAWEPLMEDWQTVVQVRRVLATGCISGGRRPF